MKRSKKFKLDKEAINKIDSEYDDRDLSNYTNYEVYEEEKPRHRFLKKLVKRLIILCAVVLVINLAVLLYTGRLWFNEPKKRDYPIRGPVVTESMGEIRWKSFAKQNIQTAYIRATKGTTFEDGAFRDNWNGSKDTDISVGAYHVLELDTDGTKQAEHFINAVGDDLSGRLIPAVEVRLRGLYRLLPPDYYEAADNLADFCDRIEKQYGVRPVIYCTERTYKNIVASDSRFNKDKIWYESLFSKPDEDMNWTFWTYTNRVKFSFYALQKGMAYAEVQDFYDENCPTVKIPLDKRLTPTQNAQKYYKEYRKLDTAEKKLTVLISEGEQEVKYLDSVFDSLTRAQTEGDIAELREELFQEGYVKRSKFKGKPPKALPPIRYRSSDGYDIRVGRNNKQNDRLTCKEAEKTDLWLHVKDITGSHVIVTCDGEMPPDRTIEEAAIIAACNSKGRNSSRVDVDYTFIRNVKKPNGSKPGMVIFTNNYTITVKPDTELEEKLRV